MSDTPESEKTVTTGVSALSTQLDRLSKVVVGHLDGRRSKGLVSDFSPGAEQFRLVPEENSPHHLGLDVKVEGLKAVFFLKDGTANSAHHGPQASNKGPKGLSIEVTFRDGEKITGTTETYDRNDIGFFLVPADPDSNNARIFVVNKNVREVKVFM